MILYKNIQWFVPAIALLATGCMTGAVDDEIKPVEGKGKYALSVSGQRNDAATRAELGDDRVYRWSAADRVGLYVTPHGEATPIADNVRLTGVNASPVARTDFEGELSREQVSALSPDGSYDYYSYYPYDAAMTGFPNISVGLSAVRTVRPDVFGAGCVMVAKATDREAITWLDDGAQRFGERLGFSYDHVFSYAELYLACNLMSQRITRIVITDNGGGVLAGDFAVDITTGNYTASNTSSTLTLDIEGGMDVLDGRLYIPIPAADLTSHSFTVTLTTEHGNSVTMDLPRGVDFQRGKIHKLALKVPFLIDFEGIGSDGRAAGRFTFRGYDFTSNGNPELIQNNQFRFEAINSAASGVFYYQGGDITKDNDKRGTLTLPAINVANTAGRADIPVRVEIVGNGEAVLEGDLDTHRLFYYKAVAGGYQSYLSISNDDPSLGYIEAGYTYTASSYDSTRITSSGNKTVGLTADNPSLALHYVGNFVSITLGVRVINHGHLFRVKLIPVYDEPGF